MKMCARTQTVFARTFMLGASFGKSAVRFVKYVLEGLLPAAFFADQ